MIRIDPLGEQEQEPTFEAKKLDDPVRTGSTTNKKTGDFVQDIHLKFGYSVSITHPKPQGGRCWSQIIKTTYKRTKKGQPAPETVVESPWQYDQGWILMPPEMGLGKMQDQPGIAFFARTFIYPSGNQKATAEVMKKAEDYRKELGQKKAGDLWTVLQEQLKNGKDPMIAADTDSLTIEYSFETNYVEAQTDRRTGNLATLKPLGHFKWGFSVTYAPGEMPKVSDMPPPKWDTKISEHYAGVANAQNIKIIE